MGKRVAIIPAAGLGTRLKSVYEGQKSCIRIGGKSLVEHAVSSVDGICDIAVIVGGYRFEELCDTVETFRGKYDLETYIVDENTVQAKVKSSGPSKAYFASRKLMDELKVEAEKIICVLPDVLFIENGEEPSSTLNKILTNADRYLSYLNPFQISLLKQFSISKAMTRYGIAYNWHPQQLVAVGKNGLMQDIHEFAIFEKFREKPSESEIELFREEFDRTIAINTGTNTIYQPNLFLSYFIECEQSRGLSDTDHIDVLNAYAKSLMSVPARTLSGQQLQIQFINRLEPGLSYAWMVPPNIEVVDVGTPDDLLYAKSLLEK